jgi:hypothetical protein
LTVTDDKGATGSVTQSVTVTEPPAAGVLAEDAFGRELATGWGTADAGGAWTLSGSASRFSVSGGAGRMTVPTAGGGLAAYLTDVASDRTDVSVQFSVDPPVNAGAAFVSLTGRRVGTSDYRTKVRVGADGALLVYLTRAVPGETTLASTGLPGVTYAAGDVMRVRMEVTGTAPTTLRAKVWKDGTDEPDALQAPGGVGLVSYVSTSTTNVPIVLAFRGLQARQP